MQVLPKPTILTYPCTSVDPAKHVLRAKVHVESGEESQALTEDKYTSTSMKVNSKVNYKSTLTLPFDYQSLYCKH
jgi:hypothetical protein